MNIRILSISLLPGVLLLTACATSTSGSGTTPRATAQLQRVKTIAVLPPRVEIEQLAVGGGKEQIDEWATSGKNNLAAALTTELAKHTDLTVKMVSSASVSAAQQANLEQTLALFNNVDISVRSGAGSPLSQSLGTEVRELAPQADAVLVAHGHDHIASSGRKVFQTTMTLLGPLVGVIVRPNLGVTTLSLALVDAHTGALLWYNSARSEGGYDLRDPASSTKLVERVFSDFPLH
jgi:hypothetical protein